VVHHSVSSILGLREKWNRIDNLAIDVHYPEPFIDKTFCGRQMLPKFPRLVQNSGGVRLQ
jgi:hypothetical protein